MNLRRYLAALGASTLFWLLGQAAVLILVPVFGLISKLPISPIVASYICLTVYVLFQSSMAFLATLIATNLLPLTVQRLGSCIFSTTGFLLLLWLQLAVFLPFDRHRYIHKHGIVYETLVNPFTAPFLLGSFCCVLYVFLRKPIEPLITLR